MLRRNSIFAVLLLLLSAPAFGNVRVAFDSTSLDFGLVSLFAPKALVIEVWDTSASDIQIDRLTIGGLDKGDFAVSSPQPTPFLVPASGAHVKLTVTFTPQGSGPRTAALLLQTSDGTVTIPLSGIGGGKSSLALSASSIYFGKLAPGVYRDSIIKLYSTGSDTATVVGFEIVESDTSFLAHAADGTNTPFVLAPGDSIAIRVSFFAPDLLGQKDGQLLVLGATLNTPSCTLAAIDSLGAFAIMPDTVDFGVMYSGEVRDTTMSLTNTSDVDIAIHNIDISPADAYSIVNPPAAPTVIRAGGSLSLHIRANPSKTSSNIAQLQILSRSSSPKFVVGSLKSEIVGPPLAAPTMQTLSYFCAQSGASIISIPVTDTGARNAVLSAIRASDTSLALTIDQLLPQTLAAGSTSTFTVHLDPKRVEGDTVFLHLLGGEQVMLSDTIILKRLTTEATSEFVQTSPQDSAHASFDIRTGTDLSPFGVSTLVVHLSIADDNVATIDQSSITLAPGISSAHISSVAPEPGGVAVTIASPTPFASPAGSSLLEVTYDRYVSSKDSSIAVVSIDAPEAEGCLEWTSDSSVIAGGSACGSKALQNSMNGRPIILSASLLANPVSDIARIGIALGAPTDLRFEIADDLGVLGHSSWTHFAAGQSQYTLPLDGLSSGGYTIRISSPNGSVVSLRLLKLH